MQLKYTLVVSSSFDNVIENYQIVLSTLQAVIVLKRVQASQWLPEACSLPCYSKETKAPAGQRNFTGNKSQSQNSSANDVGLRRRAKKPPPKMC